MTKPTETAQRPKRRLVAAGVAGSIAALAAVYVIVGPDGNSHETQSCTLAQETAQTIKPFATGEVAAFLPAQKALPLDELTFKKPDGTVATMSDFKDKTILMNLWATWCAPCRKEMPALDELQADLGSNDFEVVAVNLDRGGEEKPKAFLEEIGVSHLSFYHDASNKLMTDLRTKGRATGLPTTILIGPENCEIGTMYGPAEWASGEAKKLIEAALKSIAG
ncbi:thiol:disulfide interchange protein TlpA [Roseibium polysiphoniae]|uniref:TlpA family protein disulfide reductase n=1 Tax=Roseibium polysiphoniae TaxID=2571221 RepID=A0ABR9CEQ0_9HYPH|nr:TlpA disulfide reductase family protein [Roseibium polysiphoniae]MBD8877535.1 TlpA family protein disulfide reductase [Roseibium polysiphoniae]